MTALLADEALKIGVLLAAFVGVYGLSRWASRQSESVPPVLPLPHAPKRAPDLEPPKQWSKVVSIDGRSQFARTETVDEAALKPVRILDMYFSRFDIIPGPPDPTSFADEIFIDLYDDNSGYKWTGSYFVTTPHGLDQMLQDEHWLYAFADKTFFVRRYDAKLIRQMIVEHLIGTQERPSRPKDAEDTYV